MRVAYDPRVFPTVVVYRRIVLLKRSYDKGEEQVLDLPDNNIVPDICKGLEYGEPDLYRSWAVRDIGAVFLVEDLGGEPRKFISDIYVVGEFLDPSI